MAQPLPSAVDVLREFVRDVEAVGIESVEDEWPDILVTYRKAKRVLKAEDLVVVEHHR